MTVVMLFGLQSLFGCQDMTTKLPAGTVNPKYYATAEAALQMARNTRFEFMEGLLFFMLDAGGISDEFSYQVASNQQIVGYFNSFIVLDSRVLPDIFEITSTDILNGLTSIRSYRPLQRVRSRGHLALHALRAYAPESPGALQAEMAAYAGFAEIMLADLFCSGIPLSVIEFEGDFRHQPGSSTQTVYEHAVTLFDTALALAGTDPSIRALAQIGKARALLNLGRYTEAAQAVAEVPTGFTYSIPLLGDAVSANYPSGVAWDQTGSRFGISDRGRIANRKGGNGLDFVSADDPRIQILCRGLGGDQCAFQIPAVQTQLKVATYVEARLIEAEAALHAGDPEQFLSILNALRTDGSIAVVGGVTQYGAGTGGVAGLPPLIDPGLESSTTAIAMRERIDLLMRERAFWLFFTGHRQGDLRRLLRHYDRAVESVYPTGPYPAGTGMYESYVDIPITGEADNPFYHGCLRRGE